MMFSHRLSTRTFLVAFLPVGAALVGGFLATRAVVRERVKIGLSQSLLQNEIRLQKIRNEYDQQNRRLVAILSENAGLKAAIGLSRETSSQIEIQRTIEDQLRELSGVLDYDVLLVADPQGKTMAALVRSGTDTVALNPDSVSVRSSLLEIQGKLYDIIKVPINLDSENLGSIAVGRILDISSLDNARQTVLLHHGKVIRANLPTDLVALLEQQLSSHCGDPSGSCGISLNGEDYLVLPLRHSDLGEGYRLLSLHSVREATEPILLQVGQVFTGVGAFAVVAVLLLSALGSRSVAKPITDLIARLKECEQTGHLSPNFETRSGTQEVDRLAEAFNRAADAMFESQQHLNQAYLQFIETMAQALDARDPYTAGHSQRVSDYSTAIARAMGLPDEELETIRIGALLHDIGKIGVADAVLQKPDRLTNEEFELIKLHPQIGKRILERVDRFQAYLPIVELHHENQDGSGYPYGMAGSEIPLGARIVHVSDAYDAMTTSRAYRTAMPTERVLRILRECSSTQFDAEIVEVWLSTLAGEKQSNEEVPVYA